MTTLLTIASASGIVALLFYGIARIKFREGFEFCAPKYFKINELYIFY